MGHLVHMELILITFKAQMIDHEDRAWGSPSFSWRSKATKRPSPEVDTSDKISVSKVSPKLGPIAHKTIFVGGAPRS